MGIVAYRADSLLWCPDCAIERYGNPQLGEFFILDSAGEQVLPVLDPGLALHLVTTCAGECGASLPAPRARPASLPGD